MRFPSYTGAELESQRPRRLPPIEGMRGDDIRGTLIRGGALIRGALIRGALIRGALILGSLRGALKRMEAPAS